ncbi:MAG TPA: hypothetical protein VF060_00775 [Trebonia sp.]
MTTLSGPSMAGGVGRETSAAREPPAGGYGTPLLTAILVPPATSGPVLPFMA